MDKHAITMYFPMIDRFVNARSDNDFPVSDPDIKPRANYLGGDLAGVIRTLQNGYFDEIGINTIWLSPIPQNAEGSFGLWDKGGVSSEFSAYHGYWPTSFTKIDYRYGTAKELKMLVNSAHNKQMNVLLDFIANHVHEDHPVYQANKDDGWATDLYLPDGSLNTERWDDHRLTTWFDVFLPSLNLEKIEVTEMVSDSALYWLKEYNIDGFRHDATKHIPEIFWRTLSRKVKAHAQETNREIYQVGETYGTTELISSYIGSGMLDAQFDFNVYDALVNSICREAIGFEQVVRRINESMEYYGSHHLMGNMSGNQDKPRLMSLATGEVRFDEDTKQAGWSREIHKQTKDGFDRVAMMHLFNFTIPGVPVVYYGDEIGMPGGNDPDNRRMMKFDDLSDDALALKSIVSKLAKIRTGNMALIYGEMEWLTTETNQLAFVRQYMGDAILVLVNNASTAYTFNIDLPATCNTGKIESTFENSFAISGQSITCTIPPGKFELIQLAK
jgi:glycosidase